MCKSVFSDTKQDNSRKIKKGLCLNVDDAVILPVGRGLIDHLVWAHTLSFLLYFLFFLTETLFLV